MSNSGQYVNFEGQALAIERGEDNIIKVTIPSNIPPLFDVLYMHDGYVDYIIGADSENHIHVRWY